MSPYAFLKRHITFKKSPPPQENDVAPKPATPTPRTRTPSPRPRTVSPPRSRITTSNTPQWTWTNVHCKAWIYEICIIQLGYSSENAETICNKFLGIGPTLYAMDRVDWEALLGRYNGMGVYSTLLSLRNQAGAVPENIEMSVENGNNVNGNADGEDEKKLKRRSWRKKS
ncbi:hypothetical protein BKA64DRAFT_777902 [Cadophora sp. MPI-SDFR-AT-0126]|nr:hypothetical protein BKA64DRAFT_777902 [Leotiomycetes sp. MPI-SDFR-AT-0126]